MTVQPIFTSRDRNAFEVVYRDTFDRLTRYVARRVREPADVADLVAGTYAEALASWARFDPRRGSALPWLVGIAHNLIAMDARRRRYAGLLDGRIIGRELLAPDEFEAIEQLIDAVRLAPRVQRAIAATLDAADAELLLLVRQDGLSAADAARALGISHVSARARISRARRRVRQHLAAEESAAATTTLEESTR